MFPCALVADGRLGFDHLNGKSEKSAVQRLSNSLLIPPIPMTLQYLPMILKRSLGWPSMTKKSERRSSGQVWSREYHLAAVYRAD